MQEDSVKTRVAQNDLQNALGRGVFAEDRLDLFPDGRHHVSIIMPDLPEAAFLPLEFGLWRAILSLQGRNNHG